MVTKLYSIYDVKTQVFMPPMVFHNDSHAMRNASSELDRDTMISKFPNDFELMECGKWDDSQGVIVQDGLPRMVCRFSELREKLKDE